MNTCLSTLQYRKKNVRDKGLLQYNWGSRSEDVHLFGKKIQSNRYGYFMIPYF